MEELSINLLIAVNSQFLLKNPFLWGVVVILILTLGEFSGLNSLIKNIEIDDAETDVSSEDAFENSFEGWAEVENVIDGDTVRVRQNGESHLVRLIGVDTPETVHPNKPVECFGREASARAKAVLNGRSVRLERDLTQDNRDKYGRFLRYIFLEDGTNFNRMMIREGFAFEYTYESEYKYQTAFQAAQLYAEVSNVGLWADEACGF